MKHSAIIRTVIATVILAFLLPFFGVAQEIIPFSYKQFDDDTASTEGSFTLVISQKWNPAKSEAEFLAPGGTADFEREEEKATKGYIVFDFRNLVDPVNDKTEIQFLSKDFTSSPKAKLIFPQSSGVAYLKKGGWGTPVIFEVNQNTTYTFTIKAGLSTKPNSPVTEKYSRTYVFTVTGLGVEPVKKDTVKEEGLSDEEILKLWEYAQRQNTPREYRNFISQVKKGELVEQAKDLLTLEYKIERDKKRDDLFIVSFFYPKLDNAPAGRGDVRIGKIEGLNGPIQEDPEINWTDKGMEIVMKDIFNPHELTPVDFVGRSLPVISLNASDARLEAIVKETSLDSLQILITGGKPPYQMYFVLEDKGAADRLQFAGKLTSTDIRLDKNKLAKQLKVTQEGDYYIEIVDERGYSFAMEETKIHLIPPPLIPPFVRAIFAGLAVIFLFIGFLVARRRRKKNQETEQLLEELRKNKRQGAISILPREFRVDTHGFWRDSAISQVVMTREFIQDINSYFAGRDHSQKNVPLVIGFILGQIPDFSFETEQYEVLLEKLTLTNPFPPKEHKEKWDVLKREIDKLKEYNSDQKVIGWVVMHKGQGDALTPSELEIHEKHFNELFQLAMKIDLVGNKFETGFFTKKRNGEMNKSNQDRVKDKRLLDWDDEFIRSGKF